MNTVAICIPTYKRPLMLEHLLQTILNSEIDESQIKAVHIIVVDNDSHQTASRIVKKLANPLISNFSFQYHVYPVKGLSSVRNELIKKALEKKTDYIVFIDDDEFVTQEWLKELLKTILFTNADAVRGPVLPVITDFAQPNIWYWFKREKYENNSQLKSLATGNLMIKRTSFEKYNVWFDNRFNLSGSEDGYFGMQFLKKGAKIHWANKAIAYETIPESRLTLTWLVKRIYRTSSTYSYMLKLEHKYSLLSKKVIVSVIYVLLGIPTLLMMISKSKLKYWGILKMVEGIGGLMGIANKTYKEYDSRN
jgi:succinoglycan biosynthesis protein ExoM